MPYIVETDKSELIFPSICPFCEKREAKLTKNATYAKTIFFVPGLAVWREYDFKLPACAHCVLKLSLTALASIFLIVGSWGAVFVAMAYGYVNIEWLFDLALYASAFAVALILWRQYIKFKLRIGHIGSGKITYYCRSKKYASNLARLNSTTAAYKLIHIKLR